MLQYLKTKKALMFTKLITNLLILRLYNDVKKSGKMKIYIN